MTTTGRPFTAFLIAGEESGDLLGAGLMQALRQRLGEVSFLGVGGDRMAALGLASLFPMHLISFHGVSAIVANLHRILARMRETAKAVVAADPDVLVIIDCPGFNLGVARRVRKWSPSIPIVDYVSPSVWVWRPDRARRMARFVDQILAILPFEPAVHERLGGPPCTYVGHPLMQRLSELRPATGERPDLGEVERPTLLVLPGSRAGEVKRLTGVFGETIARVVEQRGPVELVLPAVPRFAGEIKSRVASWPVRPTIVEGEAAKLLAFRRAHAALAASGTATLELALAGVPMVVAYRVDPLVKPFKHVLARINSFVLPNLITGGNAIPEFLDAETTPERMSSALLPLLSDTPERRRQLAMTGELDTLMRLSSGTPSGLAAEMVLETLARRGASAQRRLEIGT
jgi:lipid-A-disaccharide synthase